MTGNIVFCAPDRQRAERAADELAPQPTEWLPFEHGEAEHFVRVEYIDEFGWCVVRVPRHKVVR